MNIEILHYVRRLTGSIQNDTNKENIKALVIANEVKHLTAYKLN